MEDLPQTSWANGRGTTRVISIEPHNATMQNFLWRFSAATLRESGPFSLLPGVDRSICLIRGPGAVVFGVRDAVEDSGFEGDREVSSVELTSPECNHLGRDTIPSSRLEWTRPLYCASQPFSFGGEDTVRCEVAASAEACESLDVNVMTRRGERLKHCLVALEVPPGNVPSGVSLVSLMSSSAEKSQQDEQLNFRGCYIAAVVILCRALRPDNGGFLTLCTSHPDDATQELHVLKEGDGLIWSHRCAPSSPCGDGRRVLEALTVLSCECEASLVVAVVYSSKSQAEDDIVGRCTSAS